MAESDRTAYKAAAKWIVLLDDPDVTDEIRLEFEAWLASDPRHGRAVEALRSVWSDFDSVLKFDESAVDLGASSGIKNRVSVKRLNAELGGLWTAFRGRSPQWKALASGAVVLVVAGIGGLLHFSSAIPFKATYETEVGKVKTVRLPDESSVFINTASRVRARYSDNVRLLTLERGEAHFDVVTDADQPFVVHAGDQIVRAIGTAFSVRLLDERVRVAVSKGSVLVAPVLQGSTGATGEVASAPVPPSANVVVPSGREEIVLQAGAEAVFGDDERVRIQEVPIAEIERKLAWRHGGLIFDQDRLEDVVDTISQYTSIEIRIVDREIVDLQVGGYFRIGEVDAMLGILEVGFGLQVVRVSDSLIEIRRNET